MDKLLCRPTCGQQSSCAGSSSWRPQTPYTTTQAQHAAEATALNASAVLMSEESLAAGLRHKAGELVPATCLHGVHRGQAQGLHHGQLLRWGAQPAECRGWCSRRYGDACAAWVETADDALTDSTRAHTSHLTDRRYERLAALRSIAAVQKLLSSTGGTNQAALQCQAAAALVAISGHSTLDALHCKHLQAPLKVSSAHLCIAAAKCRVYLCRWRPNEGSRTP